MLSRRRAFTWCFALAAFGVGSAAIAQTITKPFVVYDDGLQNGWQSWSWAKVQLEAPTGDVKPIEVHGDPWTALALHHDPFSTAGFTKLTFFINGGVDGGQSIYIKLLAGGKPIESAYQIQPKAKTWTKVEVELKDLGVVSDMTIDTICLQGAAEAYKSYYVTKIQLE